MADWHLDGRPRTARRYTTYTNCPLPTPEDRLLFILIYLKTYPLQSELPSLIQCLSHWWDRAAGTARSVSVAQYPPSPLHDDRSRVSPASAFHRGGTDS